jgi:hypothetical protein
MAYQVERFPASLLEYVDRSARRKVTGDEQNGEVKEEMRTSERGRRVLREYIDIGLLAGQY